MAFIGKTFNYRPVTAGDDGELYNMLSGRENRAKVNTGTILTISNNVLTTGEISLLVSGRFVRVSNGTTISLGTIPTTATKGRVIIRLDMTKNATESGLWQIETEVETTTASGSFRSLTQQNINSISGQSNNVYEAVLCTFTCASGTASDPVLDVEINMKSLPLYDYQDASASLNISAVDTIYNKYATRCSVNALLGSTRYWFDIFYSSGNFGLVLAYHSVNPPLSKVFALRNGSWTDMGTLFDTGCIKVTYTNEALTGLNAKQLKVESTETLSGITFGTTTAGRNYITLPIGRYRIHTNFRSNPGANGFIKTCLKIGNTSTLFIITDRFYAGAGCGTNASIIGVNATDIINLTASTNIYFLVMSQNNTDGCEGSLTIERLE